MSDVDVEVSCLVELSDSALASRRKPFICSERRGDRFAWGGDGAAGGGEGDRTAGGGCDDVGDRASGEGDRGVVVGAGGGS